MGLRNRSLYKDYNCFFVTTGCRNHVRLFEIGNSSQIIIDSLCFVTQKYQVDILGYVIMPNHLHIIWYFKKENCLSSLMRDFKKYTSTQIRKEIEKTHPKLLKLIRLNTTKRAFQVWEDRFDDVWLEDVRLLETKLDYIHNNPLQEHWNLVSDPIEYTLSSAAFYEGIIKVEPLPITDYREYF